MLFGGVVSGVAGYSWPCLALLNCYEWREIFRLEASDSFVVSLNTLPGRFGFGVFGN